MCNWLVAAESTDAYCHACYLNRTIPNLDIAGNLVLWRRLEAAKHRMVYGLLRFDLPLSSKSEDTEHGLAFDFLSGSDSVSKEGAQVLTGHGRGLITIDIAEADDAERERQRRDMAEPYRTRFWAIFAMKWAITIGIALSGTGIGTKASGKCSAMSAATTRRLWPCTMRAAHHPIGRSAMSVAMPAPNPWEDFAETWAHYRHIVDTLETAEAFGISVHPRSIANPQSRWLSISTAMNNATSTR